MMEEKRIIEAIQAELNKLSGDKTGGSGHIGNISYGNPKIERVELNILTFKCEVWVQSEFEAVEKDNDNPFNPYHYWKTGTASLDENSKIMSLKLD